MVPAVGCWEVVMFDEYSTPKQEPCHANSLIPKGLCHGAGLAWVLHVLWYWANPPGVRGAARSTAPVVWQRCAREQGARQFRRSPAYRSDSGRKPDECEATSAFTRGDIAQLLRGTR